ncbi:MAG: DUF1490 domain-containing protein [Firmicutes bacterium]|nr:DUF1490 domain-containing protein [Bacillota bacterium]
MLKDLLKNEKLVCFVVGAAAAIVGGKVLKCSKTRELCVQGLAKGMKLKHDTQTAMQNLKEDAQDIYYDAMTEAETDDSECTEE